MVFRTIGVICAHRLVKSSASRKVVGQPCFETRLAQSGSLRCPCLLGGRHLSTMYPHFRIFCF
uniref:Uncharacterized protein n=1 Tax=Hyaloperonospora arabidopsidis (strain Emoy2) TaxID=559515 RepID=M4BLU0_HYAAE